jgi:hypothetical protein
MSGLDAEGWLEIAVMEGQRSTGFGSLVSPFVDDQRALTLATTRRAGLEIESEQHERA